MIKFGHEWNGNKITYPAFKFLAADHARLLLNDGNVHLPTLHEFRDETKHSGLIHDRGEGVIYLANHYSSYEGLAKDANGLLPTQFDPYEFISARNQDFSEILDSGNFCIYCLTRFFFSDSLEWAISEGKKACVLITDVEKFLALVSDSVTSRGLEYVDSYDCCYITDDNRRVLEIDPGPNGVTNQILARKDKLVPFIKPTKYRAQKEIRAAWKGKDKEVTDSVTQNVESVKELLIPVDFSKIRRELLLSDHESKISIGVKIIRNSGMNTELMIQEPRALCSPVLYMSGTGGSSLGFVHAGDPIFGHIKVSGATTGIMTTPIGPILCHSPLEDVRSIEFFHGPDITKGK